MVSKREIEGEIVLVRRAGSVQFPEGIRDREDVEALGEEADVVTILEEGRERSSFLGFVRGVDDGRRDVLVRDLDLREEDQVSLTAYALDEDAGLFLRDPETPIVRIEPQERPVDLEVDEPTESLGTWVIEGIPLVDRINGALLRRWRRVRS